MNELIIPELTMGNSIVPAKTYAREEIKKAWAPNATDSELDMFLTLASTNQLDPFRREIYFIKYGNTKPSYVTGYQVYLQRAAMSGKLDGWEVTVNEHSGKVVSATITIYRNDMNKPVKWTVLAAEFDKGQANWKTMPTFMIQKVAIGQGFRLAFPEYLSGMPYLTEEITSHREDDITSEVVVEDKPTTTKKKGGTKKTGKAPNAAKTRVVEPPTETLPEDPESNEGEGAEDPDPPAGSSSENKGEGTPPVPEGVDPAPAPDLMEEKVVTAMLAHFGKQGITEDIVTAVLECPKGDWTESHRVYLQSAWYKLTDQDPAKKMSLEDFAKMRYSGNAPF